MIVLHLPFPPSLNSANNYGRKGYYPSEKKEAFFREADALFLAQKRGLKRVDGAFTYHIILNAKKRRSNADGDNHTKYVLDFAQRVGLIENDKLAEGGSWSWGSCQEGCMLSIHPISNASSETSAGEENEPAGA